VPPARVEVLGTRPRLA